MSGWVEALDTWWSDKSGNLYTALPGVIKEYDPSKRVAKVTIDVQLPTYREFVPFTKDLTDVPVIFPSTAKFSMVYPIEAGDGCLIIVCTTSLTEWFNNNVTDTPPKPGTLTKYGLGGAVCLPGLFQKKALPKMTLPSDSFHIHYDGATIDIGKGGKKIELKTADGSIAIDGSKIELKTGSSVIEMTSSKVTINSNLEVSA